MVVVRSDHICNFCLVASAFSVPLFAFPFPALSLPLSALLWSACIHSLGHCSACLPQTIGHGWMANRSYTTLKRQKVPISRGMFAGYHFVCVCVCYMLHLLTFGFLLRRSGERARSC